MHIEIVRAGLIGGTAENPLSKRHHVSALASWRNARAFAFRDSIAEMQPDATERFARGDHSPSRAGTRIRKRQRLT